MCGFCWCDRGDRAPIALLPVVVEGQRACVLIARCRAYLHSTHRRAERVATSPGRALCAGMRKRLGRRDNSMSRGWPDGLCAQCTGHACGRICLFVKRDWPWMSPTHAAMISISGVGLCVHMHWSSPARRTSESARMVRSHRKTFRWTPGTSYRSHSQGPAPPVQRPSRAWLFKAKER